MTFEEQLKLMGQPIKITLPGTLGAYYISNYTYRKYPVLFAGHTYSGYALCDLDDVSSYSWKDIYVEINGVFYCLFDYMGYCNSEAIVDSTSKIQQTVTFERLHKMFMLLYKKINELENKLSE